MSDSVRTRLAPLLRSVRRWRGLLAAACVAGAVATALPQLAPEPPPGRAVLVAARDVAAGTALSDDDLVVRALPEDLVPDGALPAGADVAGAHVSSAVRRGEPLTDARLVGPGLLGGAAGLVAAPVRLADRATGALLRPGDRVDVLAAAADGSSASAPVAASDVTVLAVPAGRDDLEGALVVLATSRTTAARLAAAAVASRLSVVVRGR